MHDHKDAKPDKASPGSAGNQGTEHSGFEQAGSGAGLSFMSRWLAGIPPADPQKTRLAGQLQRTLGNSATRRMLQAAPSQIQRVPGGTTPDTAMPETTSLDVTGSYESTDADGSYTIQLNQAGYHIQGWYQRRVHSNDRSAIHGYRIEGDMITDHEDDGGLQYAVDVTYESNGRSYSDGTLSFAQVGRNVRMTRNFNGSIITMNRISTAARPPDTALENLPENVRGPLEASVRTPLSTQEQERLVRNCDVLKARIREYTGEGRMMRMAISTNLNADINTIFSQYAPEQASLVLHTIRTTLGTETHREGDTTRSYWDWMHIVVFDNPGYTETIQRRLNIAVSGDGATTHRYRYFFTVAGLTGDFVVGLGGFVGELVVEKLEPDPWTQSYWMGIFGISGGASAGVTTGMTTRWTDFETLVPWTRSNFNGPIVISGAQVSGSLVGGASYGGNAITFYGDRALEPLIAPSLDFGGEIGVHIGAEVGITFGYIGGSRSEVINQAPRMDPVTGTGRGGAEQTIHFDVNDPSLTADGLEAIRSMSATNLALLESDQSTLQIDGYTSTTGSDDRNDLLSRLRAQNTLQTIRDVTGRRFRIPNSNITVTGHGRRGAQEAGDPENHENPDWRKVEVRLNGQIVLTLQ